MFLMFTIVYKHIGTSHAHTNQSYPKTNICRSSSYKIGFPRYGSKALCAVFWQVSNVLSGVDHLQSSLGFHCNCKEEVDWLSKGWLWASGLPPYNRGVREDKF